MPSWSGWPGQARPWHSYAGAVSGPSSAFPDSIFKQHARVGLAPFAPTKDERDYSRATREVCFWLSPRCAREACLVRALKSEGHGAPRGANVLSRFLGEKEAHRLAALHCGILGEGSVLPGQDKRDTRLDPAGFRLPSSCPRPALDEQSHVVGPDADPSLPDDMAANHARGHRILLRFMSALEKRPSRTG